MLQAIRDKVTGWIAYGIIFLISIPFALWGVNSYLGGGEAVPAVTVNGEEISQRDFDQAYGRYRQRLTRLFGGALPESFGDESVIRAQVLDQLVSETALRQYIEDRNYRIGDQALAQRISSMEEFKRDGEFEPEVYEAQLRSIGLSPPAYEQQLRLGGAMDQFQNAIRDTAFITPATRKRYASLQNQSRKIRSLRYRIDPESVQVDESEIEQHYLAHGERYRSPEQVRIDYIELSLDTIKQNIVVDEADIQARYHENTASYTSPEFRETRHILIKTDDATDDDAALQKISEIRERIQAGESFAKLAAEFSEDPLSAADGGSLGEVGRGDMVPTFEAALFALQEGELSEPVKTPFGWHLIQVDSISGGVTESYESVKARLEDEIKTELAEVQIYDMVESLANIAYEQPESLQPAADRVGFTVRTSDWFDLSSGSGIAAEAKVRQLAFSPEILEQGLNSEAIELDNDRVVFIRVRDHRPAQPQPLEQVKGRIRAELVRQKLSERSLQAGRAGLESLRSGTSLEALAEEWSASIADHGFVERGQAEIDPAILQRSFTMPKPEQGAEYDGVALGGGEYAVIELSAVISNTDELQQETAGSLQRARASAEYQAALKYLGSRAEVVKTPLEELSL